MRGYDLPAVVKFLDWASGLEALGSARSESTCHPFCSCAVTGGQKATARSINHAAAVGELYTANAVQTTPGVSFFGREAIERYITDLFQRHNPSDRVTKMSYVYAFGGDLCALGGWTITIGGYLAIVYTFVGGTWKIRTSVFKYPTS